MDKSKAYDIARVLCWLHAALLSITITTWMVHPGSNTGPFKNAFLNVWEMFLFIWPLWLIVLAVLCFFEDRKLWKVLVPFGVGIFILIPALFIAALMWSFGHYGPG